MSQQIARAVLRAASKGPGTLLAFLAGAAGGFLVADAMKGLDKRSSKGRGSAAPSADGQLGVAAGLDDARTRSILAGSAPSGIFRRVSDHFVAEYDTATRNPRWVAEHLTKENTKGNAEREHCHFKEDAMLPVHMRARLNDYVNSGYDRGHMAPAANHKTDETSMTDSFFLSNIAPQIGAGCNRDYWNRLEKFVRDLTKQFDDVHVVTGPLYVPQWEPVSPSSSSSSSSNGGKGKGKDKDHHAPVGGELDVLHAVQAAGGQWVSRNQAIGRALHWVQVPTHFYKIIYCHDAASNQKVAAAFVVPNAAIQGDRPLVDFVVPLHTVEAAAGLSFFRDQLDQGTKTSLDSSLYSPNSAEVAIPGLRVEKNVTKILLPKMPSQLTKDAAALHKLLIGSNGSGGTIDSGGADAAAAAALLGPTAAAAVTSLLPTAGRPVRHLCSVVHCALPAEGWFDKNGRNNDNGDNHNQPEHRAPSNGSKGTLSAAAGKAANSSSSASKQTVPAPPATVGLDAAVSQLGAIISNGKKGG